MEKERFEALLKELDGESLQTLITKNARYSSSDDALHNFRAGGDILGGTPAQACWGYLTKHLVALRDMVERDDFANREDFLEKCQDSINYIRFLWCIGNEAIDQDAVGKGVVYVCKECGAILTAPFALRLHQVVMHQRHDASELSLEKFIDKYYNKETE